MKLIDKTALVAEIENIESSALCEYKSNKSRYSEGSLDVVHRIKSFIDTLEVEEVELDKPLEGIKVQTSMESGSLDEVIVTTRYKAQKGK